MPSFLRPVAALAIAATVHAAHAETTQVEVVGQLPVHVACPAVDEDLAAALVSTWDDVAKPSAVAVSFTVRDGRVLDVAPDTDAIRTRNAIRRAVHGLRCSGGDERAHAVNLVVRFEHADDDRAVAIVDTAR